MMGLNAQLLASLLPRHAEIEGTRGNRVICAAAVDGSPPVGG